MADTVPAWLIAMRAIDGTRETPGAADNPVILSWAAEIGRRYPDLADYAAGYTHDSIAWCGLTVAYVMARAGIKPPATFLWARDWAAWGVPTTPKLGAVMVFTRDGGGHVALYEGETDTTYRVRGGNQSDAVNVTERPKSALLAARWPATVPATVPAIPTTSPAPTPIALPKGRLVGITATVFGGADDPQASAYGGRVDPGRPSVALPFRFVGARPQVRVWRGGRSVVCDVVDVGPWNTRDPYWLAGSRPQAETGTDTSGRSTNRAGIDLTPAAAQAIGLDGKGAIDWEFVDTSATTTAPTPSTTAGAGAVVIGSALAGLPLPIVCGAAVALLVLLVQHARSNSGAFSMSAILAAILGNKATTTAGTGAILLAVAHVLTAFATGAIDPVALLQDAGVIVAGLVGLFASDGGAKKA